MTIPSGADLLEAAADIRDRQNFVAGKVPEVLLSGNHARDREGAKRAGAQAEPTKSRRILR